MPEFPLVCAIMPTQGKRRRFIARALTYFERQDYPNKYLRIVQDDTDWVVDLMDGPGPFGYSWEPHVRTIGAKRNNAIRYGPSHAELIMHWDDDDWMAPNRMSRQVAALLDAGADLCGLPSLLYYDITTHQAHHYLGPGTGERWLAGGSLLYRKSLWEQRPFRDISVGDDVCFVDDHADAAVCELDDPSLYVAITHPGNTSPRWLDGGGDWQPYPITEIKTRMGPGDWSFYASLESRHHVHATHR